MRYAPVSNNTELIENIGVVFAVDDNGKLNWRREHTQLIVWRGSWIDLNPLPLLFFSAPQNQIGTEVTFV